MNAISKTIALSTPVVVFGTSYSEIVVKRPSAALFFELGNTSASYRVDGVESSHDLPKVIRSYLERTITNIPDAASALEGILRDADLADGLRLRRAINEFFSEAIDTILGEEALAEAELEASAG